MGEEGEERPIDKYCRYKENINLWYNEMTRYGLSADEQHALEPYFKPSYGVPPSQEQLMKMLMDENICHFTLGEANAARKVVGKKQMNKIPALRQKVLEQAASPELGRYVWKFGVGPQMGYSFSLIHALAYSFIGAQTLYIATHWNPIYWNTACLIVNSGSLVNTGDDDEVDIEDQDDRDAASTDYGKMAKALGDIIEAGVKVAPIDINTSSFGFRPNVENNQILFGLKGLLNVSDDFIQTIIANRPYRSPKDFLRRAHPTKQQMVSLIKSGAFDQFINRKSCMAWYIWETCDKKQNITLQNMGGLMNYKLIPEEYKGEVDVYRFNKYLRDACKYNKEFYKIDTSAIDFLCAIEKEDLIKDNEFLNVKSWDKVYQSYMDVLRAWIAENKPDILQRLNDYIFLDDWKKYAKGTISSWEMEVMCFYYHEHELAHINFANYGLDDFFSLSPDHPEIDKAYYRGGKEIKLYKLHKICGTCIAKNKTKSVVTLLTPTGVVNVKFRKEYFTLFDKQIAEKGVDGKKHVVEKSWFNRGSMIIVMGIRQGDDFIPKKYASSIGHQLYKITEITPENEIVLQVERYKGDIQE